MDAIGGILAFLVILALAWAMTKSKLLTGLVNGIGLITNIFWGTVFVGGGLWGLLGGHGIVIPLLSIGVGIYFFTTSRFDAKVSAAIGRTVEAVADKAAEKLAGDETEASAASVPADHEVAESQQGKPSLLTTRNLLLVVAVIGIAYGLWALRDVGDTTYTIYLDGSMDSETSYGSPFAWISLLAGGSAAAVWEAMRRRGVQGRAIDAATVQRAAASVAGLDEKTKKRAGLALAAVVVVVGGVMAANSIRAAWSYRLEGEYAEREAEGIAQLEAEASYAEDYAEEDYAETDEADTLTPNGNARWMQLPDILAMAPEDGGVQHAMATWVGGGGDSGCYLLTIDDISLGGSDSSVVWDVQLFDGEVGECYIDERPVSEAEFFDFLCGVSDFGVLGSIEFTADGILRSNVYSDDYVPADGY